MPLVLRVEMRDPWGRLSREANPVKELPDVALWLTCVHGMWGIGRHACVHTHT